MKDAKGYRSAYAQKLTDFFCGDGENGESLPTLDGFARSIGATLAEVFCWADDVPEFKRALCGAMRCKRERILDRVLDGSLSPSAAKFVFEEYDRDQREGGGGDGVFLLKVDFEGADGDTAAK